MLIVRLAKIAMVASLAAFAFIVTYDNIVDYGTNYEFVKHVLSMDTTFPGNKLTGRAIANPTLWNLAYGAIILAEGLTFLLLGIGATAMFLSLRAPASGFHRTKAWLVAGVTLGFLIWFFGFMVVGGEYFAMWQSKDWNGQQPAFRFYMTMLAVLIFVMQPDAELD